jgi:hypothetical protein
MTKTLIGNNFEKKRMKAIKKTPTKAQLTKALEQALEAILAYNLKHRKTYGLDGAWDKELVQGEETVKLIEKVLGKDE